MKTRDILLAFVLLALLLVGYWRVQLSLIGARAEEARTTASHQWMDRILSR
jgi:hypothetical protein